jgi:hypothetical protein
VPWIIGIDEAGYGPNLGPFVMSAVACRLPEEVAGADLWHLLRSAVRRQGSRADGRVLIADSKLVYSPSRGLCDLETAVLAAWPPYTNGAGLPLKDYLEAIRPAHHTDLADECWFSGGFLLPLKAPAPAIAEAAMRFEQASNSAQLTWRPFRSVLVCPKRFNNLLDQWKTKGAVLGHGLSQLLTDIPALPGTDEVLLFIDKHGGRNHYAAMLQNALPHGLVLAQKEGRERSVYSVHGLGREVRLIIQPRADLEFFCVALASMVSKYLREVLMHEFNRFWQTQVPGLKPTAGYPGDALRFFDLIRAVIQTLGLPEASVWRRK